MRSEENSDGVKDEPVGNADRSDGIEKKWERVLTTSSFTSLVVERRKFVNPVLFVSLTLFSVMTILATFTTLLDGRVFGPVTWGFLYNTLLFVAAFVLSLMYGRRATRWDGLSEQVRREALDHRGSECELIR